MKYKVGDKVILIKHNTEIYRAHEDFEIGSIGVVENTAAFKAIVVKFNSNYSIYVPIDSLELVNNNKELLEELIS